MTKLYTAAQVIDTMMANPTDNPYRYKAVLVKSKKTSHYYVERRSWLAAKVRELRGKTPDNFSTTDKAAQARDKVRASNFLLSKVVIDLAKEDPDLDAFASIDHKERMSSSKAPGNYFASNYDGRPATDTIKLLEGMARAHKAGLLPAFETEEGVAKTAALVHPLQYKFAVDPNAGGDNISTGSSGSNASFVRAGGNPRDPFLGRFDKDTLDQLDEITADIFGQKNTVQEYNPLELAQLESSLVVNDGSPANLLRLVGQSILSSGRCLLAVRKSLDFPISTDRQKDIAASITKENDARGETIGKFVNNVIANAARNNLGNATTDYIAALSASRTQFAQAEEEIKRQYDDLNSALGQRFVAEDYESLQRLNLTRDTLGAVRAKLDTELSAAMTRKAQFIEKKAEVAIEQNPFYGLFSSDRAQLDLMKLLSETKQSKSIVPALDAIKLIAKQPTQNDVELGHHAHAIYSFAEGLVNDRAKLRKMPLAQIAQYHSDVLVPALLTVNQEFRDLNNAIAKDLAKREVFARPDGHANADGEELGLTVIDGTYSETVPSGIQRDGSYLRASTTEEGGLERYTIGALQIKQAMALYALREGLIKASVQARVIYHERMQTFLNPPAASASYNDIPKYAQIYVRNEERLYPNEVSGDLLPVITGDVTTHQTAAIAYTGRYNGGPGEGVLVEDLILVPPQKPGQPPAAPEYSSSSKQVVLADEEMRIGKYASLALTGFDAAQNNGERTQIKVKAVDNLEKSIKSYRRAADVANSELTRFKDAQRGHVGGEREHQQRIELEVAVGTHAKTVDIYEKVLARVKQADVSNKGGARLTRIEKSQIQAVLPPPPPLPPVEFAKVVVSTTEETDDNPPVEEEYDDIEVLAAEINAQMNRSERIYDTPPA